MPSKTFDNFLAGHYGTLDPAKAPEGSFHGTNVLVYRDGSIGPRPGLRQVPFGRTPAAHVYGLGYFESINWSMVYVEGTNAYRVKPPDADIPTDTLLLGTVTHPNDQSVYMHDIGQDSGFLHQFRGSTYHVQNIESPVDQALTLLTTAPDTHGTGHVHGSRLYVTGKNPETELVKFSASNNFASWTASDFFQVGYAGVVAWMASQRGHLAMLTDDGQWWVLSGVPATGTLRRISAAKVRPDVIPPHACVMAGDDVAYYLTTKGSIPGTFDGVRAEELAHLSMTPENTDLAYGVKGATLPTETAWDLVRAVLLDPNSPAFFLKTGNGRMMAKVHGAWTRHDFAIPMSEQWVADGRGRMYAFEEATTGQRMFTANMDLGRPAFTSDMFARPGDDSDTPLAATFSLPETWTADGTAMRVRQVIVDIKKYATGAAAANQVDVQVETLGRRGLDGEGSVIRSWTEAGALATTAGKSDRIVMDFGAVTPGGGYQITLGNLKGVAVRAVHVAADDYPGQPRR